MPNSHTAAMLFPILFSCIERIEFNIQEGNEFRSFIAGAAAASIAFALYPELREQ